MITRPGQRLHARVLPAALLLVLAFLAAAGAARAGAASPGAGPRTVHFAGKSVHVPAGFGIVRVAPGSKTCERLDRRVVYLGGPSKEQSCPAGPILGRHQAIVVAPRAKRHAARAERRAAASSRVRRGAAHASAVTPRAATAHASAAATASVGGSVFTGLGFDTCSAPSSKAMADWSESPFRGVGIYIGGENSACSQPNLSASWVSAQTTAGWHLIPTYVGLQATTSSCSSCAKMTTAAAGTQGTAAAEDAVTEATAIGIGAGSPIYFDMEAYTPGTSATKTALLFLEAWTSKLHELGFQSGVYSSSGSGIADLAGQATTGYLLPDDIWTANWNNQENTLDAVIPSTAWANHQRIHQFRGGHDDTYGGTTINVDSDYVDGATVGVGTPPVGESDPIGSLEVTGSPAHGQLRVKGWAFDPDAPTETLAVNVVVGGREGDKGVETYELGQVANLERTDVGASHKLAGPFHGFENQIVTTKSGPEPVCVYAVNVALGGNRLLGCRTTTIPVAVTLSGLTLTRRGVGVNVTCDFPAGVECPGHLGLRTTYKVATPRRHKAPRIHAVTRSLAQRTFHLRGATWHRYLLPLSAGGRKILQERGKLPGLLVAAIPGGQRAAGVKLSAPAPRR